MDRCVGQGTEWEPARLCPLIDSSLSRRPHPKVIGSFTLRVNHVGVVGVGEERETLNRSSREGEGVVLLTCGTRRLGTHILVLSLSRAVSTHGPNLYTESSRNHTPFYISTPHSPRPSSEVLFRSSLPLTIIGGR